MGSNGDALYLGESLTVPGGSAPRLSSTRYRNDYTEVKEIGALASSTRTAEQTDIGYFWAANTGVLWNRALQEVVTASGATLVDNARLFALVNLAGADSAIACWDTKYTYIFWRPVTAIQNGDTDGNPKTIGDPTWQPLINTPNFPQYTSGHVAYSSAVARILRLWFKTDKVTFTVTALNPLAIQKTRTYHPALRCCRGNHRRSGLYGHSLPHR